MRDSWQSGDAYEFFMGRWSRLVASAFLDWLSPATGLRWLDVGCGSGALSEAIAETCDPAGLTAIDPSPGFVELAHRRLQGVATCKVGDALALPLPDSSIDVSVSGLVLNFISEREKALSEMMRVSNADGVVAVYIWDYPGKMEFLRTFWDAVVALDPEASSLDEATRFADSTAETLQELYVRAGFEEPETTSLEIVTNFRDFDDYWQPFLGGQGPAPTYVQSLDEAERERLRDILHERVPTQADGSIPMMARAWAARGRVK